MNATQPRPILTLSCGAQIVLNDRELAAWETLTPEARWEVAQFSPTAAHIVLSAERAGCDCASQSPTYPVFRDKPHLPGCPFGGRS